VTDEFITTSEQFNHHFKKNFLTASRKRFYCILLLLIFGIIPLFINKILTFKPSQKQAFLKEKYFKHIRIVYQNRPPIKKSEFQKPKPQTSIDTKGLVQIPIKTVNRLKSVDKGDTETHGLLLDDDSELENILATVRDAGRKEKEKLGVVYTDGAKQIAVDEDRKGGITLSKTIPERKKIVRYWTADDIKAINRTVEKNEKLIYLCYQKFKDVIKEKRGFITVQFEITREGAIDKKSIKLLESPIKNKEFVSCVLKRIKYFRGFPKPTYPNAKNYVFTKKWYF